MWGGGQSGLKIGRLGTHGRGSRVPSLPILNPPRPPPHESEDSELMAAFREFRVFRVVGWWAGRAKIGRLGTPTAPKQVPSLPILRPAGQADLKIGRFGTPTAPKQVPSLPISGSVSRRKAPQDLWTEGGEGGGWREGLGDWLAVGSRFASTDCSWIYRGEVGLEVGLAGASAFSDFAPLGS